MQEMLSPVCDPTYEKCGTPMETVRRLLFECREWQHQRVNSTQRLSKLESLDPQHVFLWNQRRLRLF